MPIIEWSESLSVNIDEIDQQHKELVNTIQRLEDSIVQGHAQATLKKVLEELIEYLNIHFQTEERIFKLINYPLAVSHKEEHLDFVRKVTRFKDEYEDGKVGLTVEVMNFLGDWARNHLKNSDKKYAEFIAEQQHIQ